MILKYLMMNEFSYLFKYPKVIYDEGVFLFI